MEKAMTAVTVNNEKHANTNELDFDRDHGRQMLTVTDLYTKFPYSYRNDPDKKSLENDIPRTDKSRVIVRWDPPSDEYGKIYPRWGSFSSYREFYTWILATPKEHRTFYNVIYGEDDQILHFDIEIPRPDKKLEHSYLQPLWDYFHDDSNDKNYVNNSKMDAIVCTLLSKVLVKYGLTIDYDKDLVIEVSHNGDKLSWHPKYPTIAVRSDDYGQAYMKHRQIFDSMVDILRTNSINGSGLDIGMDGNKERVPADVLGALTNFLLPNEKRAMKVFDRSIYSSTRDFRTLYSTKRDANRHLVLVDGIGDPLPMTYFDFIRSMVTNIDPDNVRYVPVTIDIVPDRIMDQDNIGLNEKVRVAFDHLMSTDERMFECMKVTDKLTPRKNGYECERIKPGRCCVCQKEHERRGGFLVISGKYDTPIFYCWAAINDGEDRTYKSYRSLKPAPNLLIQGYEVTFSDVEEYVMNKRRSIWSKEEENILSLMLRQTAAWISNSGAPEFYVKTPKGIESRNVDKLRNHLSWSKMLTKRTVDGSEIKSTSNLWEFITEHEQDIHYNYSKHEMISPLEEDTDLIGDREYFNTFGGWAATLIPEDEYDPKIVEPLIWWYRNIASGTPGDEVGYWFENFNAIAAIDPRYRMKNNVTLLGKQGSIKSIILDIHIEFIYGERYATTTMMDEMLGPYRGDTLSQKRYVVCEETVYNDRRSKETHKQLVSGRRVQMPRKYKGTPLEDGYQVYIHTTNNENFMELEIGDRRNVVIQCNNMYCYENRLKDPIIKKNAEEYTDRLVALLNPEAARHILRYYAMIYKTRGLDKVKLWECAPKTSAKKEMQERSCRPLERFLSEWDGMLAPGIHQSYNGCFKTTEIIETYRKWEQTHYPRKRDNVTARDIKKMCEKFTNKYDIASRDRFVVIKFKEYAKYSSESSEMYQDLEQMADDDLASKIEEHKREFNRIKLELQKRLTNRGTGTDTVMTSPNRLGATIRGERGSTNRIFIL